MSQLAMYKRLQTRENKSINYFFMNYKMCSQHTHECLSMLLPIGIFPIVAYFQRSPLNSPYTASQCAFLSGLVWLVVLLTCWIFQCYQENRGGWRRKWEIFSAFDYEKRKFSIKCVQSACVFSDDSTISFYRSISVVVLTCAKFA